ncbi:MAG: tRNA (guanosine(37)-N1)-methyltransferase TrmD [Patescibacteria group bacterium]
MKQAFEKFRRVHFDVITLFPEIIESYCTLSVVGRARREKFIAVAAHNLRRYGKGTHQQVDDKPYGGGAGMVLQAPPLIKAVQHIRPHTRRERICTILFSAKGKPFNQRMAYQFSKKYDRFIMICGRYEGIDERVRIILKAKEISVGPYVLTDGEIPALTVISAVTRLLPGVITFESLEEESFYRHLIHEHAQEELLEYPHYTRPEVITYKRKKYHVPKVLLSGNHAEVKKWREKHSKLRNSQS